MPNHLEDMWKFEGRCSFRFQQQLETGDKIIDIRRVSQNVVRDDQVGLASLVAKPARHLGAEESNLGWNVPFLPSNYRTIRCGVYPEARYSALDEILQQIAVVTSNLDNTRSCVERKSLRHAFDKG